MIVKDHYVRMCEGPLSVANRVSYIYLLTFIQFLAASLPVFKTRLAALWNIFHPDHLLTATIFAALGVLSGYCLTELLGYSSGVWHTCEVSRYVIGMGTFLAKKNFCTSILNVRP